MMKLSRVRVGLLVICGLLMFCSQLVIAQTVTVTSNNIKPSKFLTKFKPVVITTGKVPYADNFNVADAITSAGITGPYAISNISVSVNYVDDTEDNTFLDSVIEYINPFTPLIIKVTEYYRDENEIVAMTLAANSELASTPSVNTETLVDTVIDLFGNTTYYLENVTGNGGSVVSTQSIDAKIITDALSGTGQVPFTVSGQVGNIIFTKATLTMDVVTVPEPEPEPEPTDITYQGTHIIGSSGYDMGHAVTYDNAGNLYYAGHVGDGADVDPTSGTDVRTISTAYADMLLTKMNADGTYAWSRVLGGDYFDRGSSLVADDNGNVYLAGQFSGSIDFNPGGTEDIHTSANGGSEYDIFLTRINADGSYGWTRVLGGYFYVFGRTIDVDSQGNVYVAAAFSIEQDFDLEGEGDMRSPVGGNDIALMKINADGSYGWTHTLGSTGYDMGHSVTVDDNDNVYFAGHFVGTVDLDPTPTITNFTSDSNSLDVFIMKFDSNDVYQWTKTFGGSSREFVYNIDSDDAGNVYVSGLFEGTSDLDPTEGIALNSSTGPMDIYATKLNADGSFAWTRTLGEPESFWYNVVNSGSAMSVDGAGNMYVSRCFVSNMDFNPAGGGDLRTSFGQTDIFVTRFNADGSYGWTKTMGGTSTDCANAVAASDFGDLAVTGNFEGTANFNPDSSVGDFATSVGGKDLFVTTYAPGTTTPEPPAPASGITVIADAGPDQAANEGTTVTLSGIGSNDPDGTIDMVNWVQVAGPTVTLSGATGLSPSFVAPDVRGATVLSFWIEVTDNDGLTAYDSVNVTVLNCKRGRWSICF